MVLLQKAIYTWRRWLVGRWLEDSEGSAFVRFWWLDAVACDYLGETRRWPVEAGVAGRTATQPHFRFVIWIRIAKDFNTKKKKYHGGEHGANAYGLLVCLPLQNARADRIIRWMPS